MEQPDSGLALTEHRLQLRQNGWQIVPVWGPDATTISLGQGKRPAGEGWQFLDDTSEAEIRAWIQRYPEATNTGLLTRWFPTVDIDVMEPELCGRLQALAHEMLGHSELVRIGEAPKAAIVYRTDMPFAKMKVRWQGEAPGQVEILGHGQQVVIQGIHPKTRRPFVWLDESPSTTEVDDAVTVTEQGMQAYLQAVEALVTQAGQQVIVKRNDEASRGAGVQTAPEQIMDGGRNDTLTSMAGTMRRRGFEESAILGALLAHNDTHCVPPLEHHEVEIIAKSVARYSPSAIDAGPAPSWREPKSSDVIIASSQVDDLFDTPAPPVPMLLGGLLPEGIVGTLVGTGGVGKTTMLVDLAISIASGKMFLDAFAPTAPSRTLLLVKEDDRSDMHRMIQRIMSGTWRPGNDALGGGFADRASMITLAKQNLRVASLIGFPTHLVISGNSGKTEVGTFYESLREIIDSTCQETGEALRCLILDPASRFRNANENDAGAATMLVELLDGIRDEFGTTVILSHHTSKMTNMMDQHSARGSTAFVDGMRWALMLGALSADQVEAMQLDPSCKYVMVANTKNSKIEATASLVVRRVKNGGFELEGRVCDLIRDDVGFRKGMHHYDQAIGPIQALVTSEITADRRYTARNFCELFAGIKGEFGLGKDALRALVDLALQRGDLQEGEGANAQGRPIKTLKSSSPAVEGWATEKIT